MSGRLTKIAGRLLSLAVDPTIFFSFDRTGYRIHRKTFREEDLEVDLEGEVCLVTGANSGLGRAAALGLARLGAEVWLLCRSRERGERAEEDLRLASGSDRVHLALVDLSSRRSIADFAERFGDRAVDVLVHNAGVLPASRTVTEEGFELTWATHVVGPHLLTSKLLPNLRRAGAARVVFVTSGGMYTQRLDLRDLDWSRRDYDGVLAYAQTKRAQVVLAELWAEQLAADGVDVHAMHPGWADTPGVRDSLPRFFRFMSSRLRTPAEGADTIVWLAACERIAGETGKLWFDRRPVRPHLLPGTRERPGDRERLWRLCEEAAGA